jgi:hypothetical protein
VSSYLGGLTGWRTNYIRAWSGLLPVIPTQPGPGFTYTSGGKRSILEAPGGKQKTNMGGSNANIESRWGTQYYNPSRLPPQSLQAMPKAYYRCEGIPEVLIPFARLGPHEEAPL